jgi:hypothetical protein
MKTGWLDFIKAHFQQPFDWNSLKEPDRNRIRQRYWKLNNPEKARQRSRDCMRTKRG